MMLGIEVGPTALRGACVGGGSRAAAEPFSGRLEDLSPALSGLLARLGVRTRKVALAIPSHWCSYRKVAFPYRNAARVEGTLHYALENRLAAPVEACIIEPLAELLPSGEKGSRTLVSACPVKTVSAVIEACREAGLEPIVIQPAVLAASRYLRARVGTPHARALIVRVDGEFCDVAWMDGGSLRAVQALGIPSSNAEAVAASLCLAVRACEVSDGRESFDHAFLVSGDGNDTPLAEALQEALDVSVTVVEGEGTEPAFAAARGVAAAAQKDGHLAANLRRGPCAYKRYARRTDWKVAAALLIATGISLVFAAMALRGIRRVGDALARSKTTQAEMFAEVTGQAGTPALRPMHAALAELQREADRAGGAEVVSCLQQWYEIKKHVPPSSSIVLETIDIKQGGITLKARAADRSDRRRFEKRLDASGVFVSDGVTGTGNRPGGGVSFTIELRYRP